MSRTNAIYKLELTEEEFHELRLILHTCDYFHQIGVRYNHVQHLDRLFEEAARDATDYYMLQAQEIVRSYWAALNRARTEEKINPFYAPYEELIQQPIIKLVVKKSVLENPRAMEYLRQNIPDRTIEWQIIDDSSFSFHNFEHELKDLKDLFSTENKRGFFKS